MKKIEKLLSEVYKILEEHKQNRIKNGDDFNIFKITGIQSDEVKICRVLAEIIDPMGSHNKGVFFLRLFMKNVLRIDVSEDELATAKVYVECHTVADRRIDITIVVSKPTQENDNSSSLTYIANKNTKKFHYPTCSSVEQMKESNKKYLNCTRDQAIQQGYEPCGRCCP